MSAEDVAAGQLRWVGDLPQAALAFLHTLPEAPKTRGSSATGWEEGHGWALA